MICMSVLKLHNFAKNAGGDDVSEDDFVLQVKFPLVDHLDILFLQPNLKGEKKMSKYKFELFDADVSGNVDEQLFSSKNEALAQAKSVIDSYELDEEYADDREISENKWWRPGLICNKIWFVVNSAFFDSVSVWLPGHHRKITITQL